MKEAIRAAVALADGAQAVDQRRLVGEVSAAAASGRQPVTAQCKTDHDAAGN